MEDNIFDLVNNFDSFEEAFDDGIVTDNFADNFDAISDDSQNGFFGESENGIMANDNDGNSFFESDNSDSSSGASLRGTPWSTWGNGPFDDMDGDGIPNYRDDYYGPGAKKPWDHIGSVTQVSEQSADYENISFTDIFSEFFPDFMPDPISSPQDGSTDWDRAVDNFFEMLDPTEHYHCQEAPCSCAVAVQTDILNDFGINVSEAEMRELGEEHGIFSETSGTPIEDVGKLLELHGIEVERGHHFDLDDLMEAKSNGEKVIIGLDANEIWNAPGCDDSLLETLTGGLIDIPTAGHAVEFKGVVEDFDGQYYVVIDDPGHPHGHNVRIPLDDFDDAWDDFGHFAVITHTH